MRMVTVTVEYSESEYAELLAVAKRSAQANLSQGFKEKSMTDPELIVRIKAREIAREQLDFPKLLEALEAKAELNEWTAERVVKA